MPVFTPIEENTIRYKPIPTITFDVPEKPGVQAVYTINVNGRDYNVTKLLDMRKTKGEKYWSYEVYDSKYPLIITTPQYNANKKVLKEVPDFRPDEQRHWIRHGCEQLGPVLGVGLMLLDIVF